MFNDVPRHFIQQLSEEGRQEYAHWLQDNNQSAGRGGSYRVPLPAIIREEMIPMLLKVKKVGLLK